MTSAAEHPAPRKRTGRRPGGADTRRTVLEAARAEFAALGYQKASMRAIARAAGVDAALLHHYFGSKDRLFLAALEFPVDPRLIVDRVLAGERAEVGDRVARFVLSLWEQPTVRDRLLAVLRTAAASEEVAGLMRGFMVTEVVSRVAAGLDVPQPELRVELVMSQILGLAMARYVIAVEPLASAPAEEVLPLLARAVQGYLVEA
ncbi:TetR family transcriptional regulator [Streptomyces sp. NRRL B-24484]|uniref:TetR/AcrR family transcriptional regulator n=1 Tax=Streptomyces sp. NRRL B-24484 TaxID=1463833 RepID=UPI0004C037A0|nr:TetR family transcriptional regulator [Streptomyces sp. NRRL B-24484]